MSNDDLNRLLLEYTRAIFDPTAPLPSLWPTGALGVFLVFATQIGAGIPLGVIMARDAGLSPLMTAALYLASDFLLALTVEPMLALFRWLGNRVAFVARLGERAASLTGSAGMHKGGWRGPFGVILVSFSVAPQFGRAASQAAGYGFFSGWTLAIIGDMLYFGLVMASTLVVSSFLGDSRLTVGAIVFGMWVLPMVIRRLRRGPAPLAVSRPRPQRLATATGDGVATPAVRAPRKSTTHTGRRRRSSHGLHR